MVILLTITISVSSFKTDKKRIIHDFSLRNYDGTVFSTMDQKEVKGYIVIFTCNHCPFAKLYTKRLSALNEKYRKLNIPLIAINSMDSLIYREESFENMGVVARRDSISFPYLQDSNQNIGKMFGATHTPSAFIIWKENSKWQIKYRGVIDNNGENPALATPFIANALNELLDGKKVSHSETSTFGCAIFYRKS